MADERSKVIGLEDYLDDLDLLYIHLRQGNSSLVKPFKTKDLKGVQVILDTMVGESLKKSKGTVIKERDKIG